MPCIGLTKLFLMPCIGLAKLFLVVHISAVYLCAKRILTLSEQLAVLFVKNYTTGCHRQLPRICRKPVGKSVFAACIELVSPNLHPIKRAAVQLPAVRTHTKAAQDTAAHAHRRERNRLCAVRNACGVGNASVVSFVDIGVFFKLHRLLYTAVEFKAKRYCTAYNLLLLAHLQPPVKIALDAIFRIKILGCVVIRLAQHIRRDRIAQKRLNPAEVRLRPAIALLQQKRPLALQLRRRGGVRIAERRAEQLAELRIGDPVKEVRADEDLLIAAAGARHDAVRADGAVVLPHAPVLRQVLFQNMDRITGQQTNPELIILKLHQREVVATHLAQHLRRHQRRGVVQAVAAAQQMEQPFSLRAVRLAERLIEPAVFCISKIIILINDIAPGKTSSIARMCFHPCNLFLDLVCRPNVITIHEGNIVAADMTEALVSGGTDMAVDWKPHNFQPGVSIFFENTQRIVR